MALRSLSRSSSAAWLSFCTILPPPAAAPLRPRSVGPQARSPAKGRGSERAPPGLLPLPLRPSPFLSAGARSARMRRAAAPAQALCQPLPPPALEAESLSGGRGRHRVFSEGRPRRRLRSSSTSAALQTALFLRLAPPLESLSSSAAASAARFLFIRTAPAPQTGSDRSPARLPLLSLGSAHCVLFARGKKNKGRREHRGGARRRDVPFWLATLQDERHTLGRTITAPGGGEHGRMRSAGEFGRRGGGRKGGVYSLSAQAPGRCLWFLKW